MKRELQTLLAGALLLLLSSCGVEPLLYPPVAEGDLEQADRETARRLAETGIWSRVEDQDKAPEQRRTLRVEWAASEAENVALRESILKLERTSFDAEHGERTLPLIAIPLRVGNERFAVVFADLARGLEGTKLAPEFGSMVRAYFYVVKVDFERDQLVLRLVRWTRPEGEKRLPVAPDIKLQDGMVTNSTAELRELLLRGAYTLDDPEIYQPRN